MDKREKLKQLSSARQASIIENRKSLTKETLSINKKQEKLRQEALLLLEKKQAAEAGIDYERLQNQKYSIEDVERWNQKQEEKKKVKDDGFTDFIQVASKSYHKKIRNHSVNLEKYSESIKDLSVGDSEILAIHHVPSAQGLEQLANSVKETEKSSKKRAVDESGDVTFINNRNMHFNKKLARSYDAFTKEIRENLERGTAL